MTRLDRMKRGSGIKDRDDKSNGIEIRMADALTKINPTGSLILGKEAVRINLNCSDSSGISLSRAETSLLVHLVMLICVCVFICNCIKKGESRR